MLSIPITIIALEKISIEIQAHIKIAKTENLFALSTNGCDKRLTGVHEDIKYALGMTFKDIIDSEYANQPIFTTENYVLSHIEQYDSEYNSLLMYKREFYDCINEVYTEHELSPSPEYIANYERCETIHGKPEKIETGTDTVIRPQSEVVYKIANFIC
jgi:hypothetical protein